MSTQSQHHKVPSIIFCFESNGSIPSMISFLQTQKDMTPCIPARKISFESFMGNERFNVGNASESTRPTISMKSLDNTLGCLSPIKPSYRQAHLKKNAKSDITPTIPQRKRSEERCSILASNQIEKKLGNKLLSSTKPNTNKMDMGFPLNVSNHSGQSFRSTLSTAWSAQWLNNNCRVIFQRI